MLLLIKIILQATMQHHTRRKGGGGVVVREVGRGLSTVRCVRVGFVLVMGAGTRQGGSYAIYQESSADVVVEG